MCASGRSQAARPQRRPIPRFPPATQDSTGSIDDTGLPLGAFSAFPTWIRRQIHFSRASISSLSWPTPSKPLRCQTGTHVPPRVASRLPMAVAAMAACNFHRHPRNLRTSNCVARTREQVRAELGRDILDLVQKQHPAIAQFQSTLFVRSRRGERTSHLTEKHGFDETRCRRGSAVHSSSWRRPFRPPVQRRNRDTRSQFDSEVTRTQPTSERVSLNQIAGDIQDFIVEIDTNIGFPVHLELPAGQLVVRT